LGAALTYTAVIAIAAAALRALALPLLLGPALLTLVFYLWSAYRGVPAGAASRDARWIWEVALLAVLGLVVIAWNVLAPG
jgi:small neutral amino acid transporter SnatA (MarC family)